MTERHISQFAIELIKKLLNKDPEKRIKISHALKHVWFTKPLDINSQVLSSQNELSPNRGKMSRHASIYDNLYNSSMSPGNKKFS